MIDLVLVLLKEINLYENKKHSNLCISTIILEFFFHTLSFGYHNIQLRKTCIHFAKTFKTYLATNPIKGLKEKLLDLKGNIYLWA